MMNKKWQSVVLCSLAMLLFLSLSAGVVGLSFSGASIVPEADLRVREQPASLNVEFSAYGSGGKEPLDPTQLFERARRQTVFLYWTKRDKEGNEQLVSGAGIVVSSEGYILTNAHCVSDATEPVQVELSDGRAYVSEIVGFDTETDVALLKIEAVGLWAASLSTEQLKGGQPIYVMGHPDTVLKYTMSAGIVSGLDRDIDFDDGVNIKMFQVDAAVNPGNSGGPVYDAYGRVVGMVTAKYISINTEGLGFAIPIQSAVEIAGELKEFGYVTGRPLIGITAISVSENQLKAGSPAGVMVHSADEGLPGAEAGLCKGDIIVSINGKTISSMDDLTRVKRDYKAGDTVKIRFWRDGEYLETYLTFGEVTPEHPVGPVDVEDLPALIEDEPAEEEASDEDAAGEEDGEEAGEAAPEEEAPADETEDDSGLPEEEIEGEAD